jgi:hypothetical protein
VALRLPGSQPSALAGNRHFVCVLSATLAQIARVDVLAVQLVAVSSVANASVAYAVGWQAPNASCADAGGRRLHVAGAAGPGILDQGTRSTAPTDAATTAASVTRAHHRTAAARARRELQAAAARVQVDAAIDVSGSTLVLAGDSTADAIALVSAEFAAFFSDPARIDAALGPVTAAACAAQGTPPQLCPRPPSFFVELAAVGGSPQSASPAATASLVSSLPDGWELIAAASGGAFLLGTVCALAACAVHHASRRNKVAPAPVEGDGSGAAVTGTSVYVLQSSVSVPVGAGGDNVVVRRVVGDGPAVLATSRGPAEGALRFGSGVHAPAARIVHEWQPLPGAVEPARDR